MKLLNFCNKVIEYSFYLIFFLVPLAFTSDTSELFEFNKLWVTFILTTVVGLAWFTKMAIQRQVKVQRTILDIPILLFLASQIISTIFSIDRHISIWGYYSRFNGGLLSIISYIFLYYAFVSNFKNEDKKTTSRFDGRKPLLFVGATLLFFAGMYLASLLAPVNLTLPVSLLTVLVSFAVFMVAGPNNPVKRMLYSILSSALLVALWGLPSHFGYDPTCLLFRGKLDVSCWTADFQPKVRIFSTLGQPDWMATYLAALIPVSLALFLKGLPEAFSKKATLVKKVLSLKTAYLLFTILLYTDLLYTGSRSVIAASWLSLIIFVGWFFYSKIWPKWQKERFNLDFRFLLISLLGFLVITFFAGVPFAQFSKFTLPGLQSHFNKAPAPKTTTTPSTFGGELGGTDSGTIRLYVWEGALKIWQNNPIFGTGVETFAYSYYKYRPAGHNLTSEWKYLYNKAHNEYLNYLATTGIVGLATYLSIIGLFLFVGVKYLLKNKKEENLIPLGLLTGFVAIIISNFFGFSVVIINLFFFIFPAIFFLNENTGLGKVVVLPKRKNEIAYAGKLQKVLIAVFALIAIYFIYTLVTYWNADRAYYLGSNYDKSGDYQTAYSYLKKASDMRPGEPVFKDELSINEAVLAIMVLQQGQQQGQNAQQSQQVAKQLADNAIALIDEVTSNHPNSVVYWKTRVRVFYTLSQANPTYLTQALEAIKKSAELAPTDADVSYNLGIIEGQSGDLKGAIKTLENTIKLKPDYLMAYYAIGVFDRQLSVDSKGNVVNEDYAQKAIDEMKYIIKKFGPNKQAQDALDTWQKK